MTRLWLLLVFMVTHALTACVTLPHVGQTPTAPHPPPLAASASRSTTSALASAPGLFAPAPREAQWPLLAERPPADEVLRASAFWPLCGAQGAGLPAQNVAQGVEPSGRTTCGGQTYGRFLSLDPVAGVLSEPLSTQGFTYAHASPTRFKDPDGRCVVWQGGTDFGTDFAGCGKTAAGFGFGVGRALVGLVTGVGHLTYNLTGDSLYSATGESQYRAQAEATRAMVDALASPVETAKAIVNGIARDLIEGTDRGDYFGVGSTVGSASANTVMAAAGVAGAASGVRAVANIGDDLANSAMSGLSAGVAEVGGATTKPLAHATDLAATTSAGITRFTHGTRTQRQIELFDEAETFSGRPPQPSTSKSHNTPTRTPLRWDRVSARTGGDAAHHIQTNHGNLKLSKKDQGVFFGDGVVAVEEAWMTVGSQGIRPVTFRGADHYIVPRQNSGYAGGYSGQRTVLDYITIIVEEGTSTVITAAPTGGTGMLPVFE